MDNSEEIQETLRLVRKHGLFENVATIYDLTRDEWREATKDDFDSMAKAVAAYDMLRAGMKALLEVTLEVSQGKRVAFDVENRIRELEEWQRQ